VSHLPAERAVAPNLFDVVAHPDLVFTLILANLMSPRLWEIRERLSRPDNSIDDAPEPYARRLQRFLDHHFEHVTPARVADMNGVLDLDELAKHYGTPAVDFALFQIVSALNWRAEHGALDQHALGLELIENGKFPAYTYATIDEAWACRRLLQRRKHKPWGLTCCLDEAAIFAALCLTQANGDAEDVVILGAPTHYSVFVQTPEGPWWFYTKQELHSLATWSALVSEAYKGSSQLAFNDRQLTFDRLITASGTYVLSTGESSIPPASLGTIVSRLDSFFGRRLAQLDSALTRPVRLAEGSDACGVVKSAASASSATEVLRRVSQAAFDDDNGAALRALCNFRTLDVPDPSVYLLAARQTIELQNFVPETLTMDDAIRTVASIAGNISIFDDPGRIAMPAETLRFATGTVRDKALLLHVLLERAADLDANQRDTLETIICESDSFVRSARSCISLSRMARVAEPEGRILCCLAASQAVGT
jgi:hypothetical protein